MGSIKPGIKDSLVEWMARRSCRRAKLIGSQNFRPHAHTSLDAAITVGRMDKA